MHGHANFAVGKALAFLREYNNCPSSKILLLRREWYRISLGRLRGNMVKQNSVISNFIGLYFALVVKLATPIRPR